MDRRRRGRPSLHEAHALTDVILEEALALFRRNGFAATTMEEVASACGAAKHSIYRRFSSKEELFREAVALERRRLLDCVAQIDVRENEPLASLRAIARALLHIVIAPGSIDLFRMCIAEAHRFPIICSEFGETKRQLHEVMSPFVIAAQQQGLLIDGDPTEIARRLHHAIVGEAVMMILLGSESCASGVDWDSYFDQAWASAMHGLARTAPARCT
ncbi:TetR/AcrR family transcriptional regulator [Rhodoligotrophos ferricapiens]|uniref:TetR/AcrR family transcriptional regulator n=1 Tax=Rhodoligotrophos ferricapiens TaxID=3069264 RepID=UPI00315C820E